MELWFSELITEHSRLSLRVKAHLFHEASEFQTVDVYDTHDFGRVMTIDDKFMVTDRDEFIYHDMISHVPLLAHPRPRRVLIIGGGDGGTLREVLRHPEVEEAVLCEIDPVVIEAARRYFPALSCEFDNPRARVLVRDGLQYIREVEQPFDVILIDSTDPAGPAEGLFGEAFYRSVHAALSDDGIMVAQSEGPLWNIEVVGQIIALNRRIFSEVQLYTFPTPTYPFGYWSFAFASKRFHPLDDLNEARAEVIAGSTRYYNAGVHRAAFALPNFVKRALEEACAGAAHGT